jgi:hypothetical protein
MSTPRLFLGQSGGNALLKADDGYQDAGNPIAVRLETAPVSPAGPGGEAIFTALFLTFTNTMAATVSVTPIVDGTELASQTITLPARTERTTTRHELGLSIPYTEGGQELLRTAPRGAWLQVRLSVAAIGPGDLIFDGVSVEYEVVRESLLAQPVTP